MFTDTFEEVGWPQVHRTLNEEVPRLFQVWASKQVMNLAATNKNLRWRHRDGWSNKCPCCTIHVEMAEHVILCPEEGRVEVFMQSSLFLERWLHKVDTDPELADCIVEYVQGRGQVLMEEIVWGAPERFNAMGRSQDKIGWRQFLEGMTSKKNNKGTTTALCTEWVQDESGEVVLWTYHTTARNHSWTVSVPEFHCAQSSLGHYCNSQERRTVTGNREAV